MNGSNKKPEIKTSKYLTYFLTKKLKIIIFDEINKI